MVINDARKLCIQNISMLKVDSFIQRKRWLLFWVVIIYLVLCHIFFLGYTTWDGFVIRIPPIVELVQNGELGRWKFDCIFTRFRTPFFEFIHAPFLKLFGLIGLYFSFSFVLLPLSMWAVYLFVREITKDSAWATYSALSFLCIPFVNEQPFSGYMDFAVIGALAFFLFTLIRVTFSKDVSVKDWIAFGIATFLFSMAREHAPYLIIIFFVSIQIWMRFQRHSNAEIQRGRYRTLGLVTILLLAMLPSIISQVKHALVFGSPIFPYQFKVLGIESNAGVWLEDVLKWGGLDDYTWKGMLYAFARGWLWPGTLPHVFFDSRYLGVGVSLWISVAVIPLIWKQINRNILFMLTVFVGVALIAQDFWLPRFSITLVLAISVILGAAFRAVLKHKRSWVYNALLMVMVIQLIGRPLYVGLGLTKWDLPYPRANLANSPYFLFKAPLANMVYPDWNADLLVVHPVYNKFVLLLYGRDLTNRIVWTLNPESPVNEDTCEEVSRLARHSSRKVLVIDHTGRLAEKCGLNCFFPTPWGCLAYNAVDG